MRHKSKKRKKVIKRMALIGLVAITIGIFALGKVNQEVIDCTDIVEGEVFKLTFPPTEEYWVVDQDEAAKWLNYQEDPDLKEAENVLTYVNWVINNLSASSMPVARVTGAFINEHREEFEIKLGGFFPSYDDISGVLSLTVHPTENMFVLNVNYRRFSGADRVSGPQALIVLTHELGGHLSDRIAEKNYLRSQGMSPEAIFDHFRKIDSTTPENRANLACEEMRAYALQAALYEQMEILGLYDSESARLRNILKALDWNWQSQKWYRHLNEERRIGLFQQ